MIFICIYKYSIWYLFGIYFGICLDLWVWIVCVCVECAHFQRILGWKRNRENKKYPSRISFLSSKRIVSIAFITPILQKSLNSKARIIGDNNNRISIKYYNMNEGDNRMEIDQWRIANEWSKEKIKKWVKINFQMFIKIIRQQL